MTADVSADSPFEGSILVCAPHMDDEVLGCGMLIALHARRAAVHVLVASDGSGSPEPPVGDPVAARKLPAVREAESVAGLGVLGVPPGNATFLRLPDGSLAAHTEEMAEEICGRSARIRAQAVLVPFRYDRHPDHLALNRTATAARLDGRLEARLVEYFVYTKWRMLRSGDVRDYVRPADTLRVRSAESSRLKRAALACHRSQTSLFFPGQRRPILTETLLDESCEEPEAFLFHRADRPGRRALARARWWVPFACRAEPMLKHVKDRMTGGHVR
jgi:LmbE family N-acetylglucosaminyl deacetylase